ncbi:iron ABC transporter permease, partial [Yoonia sp.]|nr:iron ABC transporter permease [Yoonia sp.]
MNSQGSFKRSAVRGAFTAIAVTVTIICVIPYVGVLAAAASGSLETLSQLAQTVLGRYTATTLILVALVMTGSAIIGAGAAWLVTMTEFPGRRWLEIALALPLAFPAYVLAYGYTHVLDHPGVVQTMLRDITGWGPR